MSDHHDESTPPSPTPPAASLAAHIRAARLRGAFSIETLAALAQVDPDVVRGLENGTAIRDVSAQDRIMNVLGLRPGSDR